ncbi:MAG TPA: DUF433 domain-containing protein [Thermoanaerobaculia bacterium]|jgi:uncharacterized protein (DUF433 family)|nr:DUF433 domain-containing protein [Thermoanaerobaculia bacterium]
MMDSAQSAHLLYGSFSPRDVPRYSIAQAARYVDLSPTTLRSWVRGRSYLRAGKAVRSEPLIKAGDLLSFSNLIEAHILRALRRDEDVRMAFLRNALALAESEYHIERLLLSEQLRAAPGEVLLEHYGRLINLGRAGQLALRHVFEAHLKRIEWDLQGPEQFFPGFVSVMAPSQAESLRLIVINPSISFGKPVLASNRGIRVSAIVSRIDAGEDEDAVAQDYGIERREVDAAIDFYERAA